MIGSTTRSIRRKFALVVLAATLAALLVAGIAMVMYDIHTHERTGSADLLAQAEILGQASASALEFHDPRTASEYVRSLSAKPDILAAVIYDAAGRAFASYTRPGTQTTLWMQPQIEGIRISGSDIVAFRAIKRGTETLGSVHILADSALAQRILNHLGIFSIVSLFSLIVAACLSHWLQGVLIQPILATAGVARRIVETKDYSLRVGKNSSDEIGDLVDAFNTLVAEVGTRAEALESSNRTLSREMQVREQAERRIRSQLGHLHLLDQITRSIGERQDLRSIFQVVLRSLEDSLSIDFGCVALLSPGVTSMRVICFGGKIAALDHGLTPDSEPTTAFDSVGMARCLQGQLVYEPALERIVNPFLERLVRSGLRSAVLAPLKAENKVFGVLLVGRAAKASFDSGECEFLRQLSEHVALATHQAQLHESLQQAYDDLRHTQQAVMQEERLRALGQMSSGIAHDINNALSPVSLYTESILETETTLSVRARSQLETIRQAVEDVAHTVARLREFYRQQETQIGLVPVDANQMVRQVLDLTKARWSDMALLSGIAIHPTTQLAPDLPPIMGIASEIREALTNLVLNAVDAMPEGGALTLRSLVREGESGRTSVVIEVSDQGVGMDEDTRRRCMEPFFTTKGQRGTGLGLAMVFGVLQRHNAGFEIESTPGAGTTMRLLFPLQSAGVPKLHVPAATSEPPTNLRLLQVDDDPMLLKSLCEALTNDGHQVVTANGGDAGIEAFRSALERGEPFAAVITDLGMPYVDGRKVAAAVKQASPSTPVILLTGWGQRLVADDEIPKCVDRVLPKPPKLREVREALMNLCPPKRS